jgi:hypothetical protein
MHSAKNPVIFELFPSTTTLFSMKNFVIQAAILGVNAGIRAKMKIDQNKSECRIDNTSAAYITRILAKGRRASHACTMLESRLARCGDPNQGPRVILCKREPHKIPDNYSLHKTPFPNFSQQSFYSLMEKSLCTSVPGCSSPLLPPNVSRPETGHWSRVRDLFSQTLTSQPGHRGRY